MFSMLNIYSLVMDKLRKNKLFTGKQFRMLNIALPYCFFLFLLSLQTTISATFIYNLSPSGPNDPDSYIAYTGRFVLPPQLTICIRYQITKHQRVVPHFFQIGTINTTEKVPLDGLLFGLYGHVPWFGMVQNSRDNLTYQPSDIEWFEFAKIEMVHYNHVWRHICIALDFAGGRVVVVDGGKVLGDITSEKIVSSAKLIKNPVEYVYMGSFQYAKVNFKLSNP